MRKIFTASIIVTFSLLLGGCCAFTSFDMDNRTGQRISVVSGHTGLTNDVAVGKHAIIPHTLGKVEVRPASGSPWTYDIDVPEMRTSGCAKSWNGWLVAGPSLRLYLAIYPDGTIYAMPIHRQARREFSKHQPPGYPMRPSPWSQREYRRL